MKLVKVSLLIATSVFLSQQAFAKTVSDETIEANRTALEANTAGKGYGPQSPRDIDQTYGLNKRVFGTAPNRSDMNLCNIHFHKNAEHAGGEFTTFAGNGDGKGD